MTSCKSDFEIQAGFLSWVLQLVGWFLNTLQWWVRDELLHIVWPLFVSISSISEPTLHWLRINNRSSTLVGLGAAPRVELRSGSRHLDCVCGHRAGPTCHHPISAQVGCCVLGHEVCIQLPVDSCKLLTAFLELGLHGSELRGTLLYGAGTAPSRFWSICDSDWLSSSPKDSSDSKRVSYVSFDPCSQP